MNPESLVSEPDLPLSNALSLSFPSAAAAALSLMPPSSTPTASQIESEEEVELPPLKNNVEPGASGEKKIPRTEIPDSEADSDMLSLSPMKNSVRSDDDGGGVDEDSDVEKRDYSLEDLNLTPIPGTERLHVDIVPVSEENELVLMNANEVESPLIIAIDDRSVDDVPAVQNNFAIAIDTSLPSTADTEKTVPNDELPISKPADIAITHYAELGEDVSQGIVSLHREMQSSALTVEDPLPSASLVSLAQLVTETPHTLAGQGIQDQVTQVSTSLRLLNAEPASSRYLESAYPTSPENLDVRESRSEEGYPDYDLEPPDSTNANIATPGEAGSVEQHLEQGLESTQSVSTHDFPEIEMKPTEGKDVDMVDIFAQPSKTEHIFTKVEDMSTVDTSAPQAEQASVVGKQNEGEAEKMVLICSEKRTEKEREVGGAHSSPPLNNVHRPDPEGGKQSSAVKKFTGLISIPDSDDDDDEELFSDATVSPVMVVEQNKALPPFQPQSELRSTSVTDQIAQNLREGPPSSLSKPKVIELPKTKTLKTPSSSFMSTRTESEPQVLEPEIPSSPSELQNEFSNPKESGLSFKSIKRNKEQVNAVEDLPSSLQKLKNEVTSQNNVGQAPGQPKAVLENSILMAELKAIKMVST